MHRRELQLESRRPWIKTLDALRVLWYYSKSNVKATTFVLGLIPSCHVGSHNIDMLDTNIPTLARQPPLAYKSVDTAVHRNLSHVSLI